MCVCERERETDRQTDTETGCRATLAGVNAKGLKRDSGWMTGRRWRGEVVGMDGGWGGREGGKRGGQCSTRTNWPGGLRRSDGAKCQTVTSCFHLSPFPLFRATCC